MGKEGQSALINKTDAGGDVVAVAAFDCIERLALPVVTGGGRSGPEAVKMLAAEGKVRAL